jgi:ABC-2 type transport system permease protein
MPGTHLRQPDTPVPGSSPVGIGKHPAYLQVILTFCRNSLVRDMSFRADFLLQCVSSMSWAVMNFALFKIIYQFTESIGRGTGWEENEFFIFLGTIWIINGLMQTFFMGNVEEFSEMIRSGNLDFALLKPIDTQFLISFPKMNWSQLPNSALGFALVVYSLIQLAWQPEKQLNFSIFSVLGFLLFIACGLAVMYSVMIALASTSIWLGRNQNLYDFWFYITNFYRYPMEIYQRSAVGWTLWGTFTFVIPILVVSNVPARVLAQPLGTPWKVWEWLFAGFAIVAAVVSLIASRWVFHRALASYRSASS